MLLIAPAIAAPAVSSSTSYSIALTATANAAAFIATCAALPAAATSVITLAAPTTVTATDDKTDADIANVTGHDEATRLADTVPEASELALELDALAASVEDALDRATLLQADTTAPETAPAALHEATELTLDLAPTPSTTQAQQQQTSELTLELETTPAAVQETLDLTLETSAPAAAVDHAGQPAQLTLELATVSSIDQAAENASEMLAAVFAPSPMSWGLFGSGVAL